jgi:hypothetical protein
MQEKWHKLFRKLIEDIDFPVDVNKLPLKARYRRRVRSGVAPEGWCHAPAGNAGERASLVGRGTFLRAAPCRRGGERAKFRTAGSGVQVQAIAGISSTITAPVMKGRRGVRFRRSVSGGEVDVQKVPIMSSW